MILYDFRGCKLEYLRALVGYLKKWSTGWDLWWTEEHLSNLTAFGLTKNFKHNKAVKKCLQKERVGPEATNLPFLYNSG